METNTNSNRNTLLLTIIAIATLLVAVVGATFAFFSLQGETSGSTIVKTQTPNVVPVTLLGGSSLKITTTANDWVKPNADKFFYATEGEQNYSTIAQHHNIATIQTIGGDSSINYKCSFTLTASTIEKDDNSNINNPNHLKTGDLKIDFSGSTIGGMNTIVHEFTAEKPSITKNITVYLNGNTTKDIKADIILVNKKEAIQNDIQNKTFTTNIIATNLKCETVTETGNDSVS